MIYLYLGEKRKSNLKSRFLVPIGEASCIEAVGLLTSIIIIEYYLV